MGCFEDFSALARQESHSAKALHLCHCILDSFSCKGKRWEKLHDKSVYWLEGVRDDLSPKVKVCVIT